jgi:sulfur-oxidizing protein SoxA
MSRRPADIVRPLALVVAVVAAGLVASAVSRAQAPIDVPYEVEDRQSGYVFLSPETRALQDDSFLNPGYFALESGQTLWSTVDGSAGKSCASCHEDAETSMAGVAARYPQYDEGVGGIINLEGRINQMRTEHMGAEPWAYESGPLLGLTTYVSAQSRGMPLDVDITGPAAPFFEAGREFFFTRRGQLDLSCNQCHDDLVGQKLRGDTISQGQINGFPIYRLIWESIASRHRMFAWCNTSLRAEPFPAGSPEYLNLELYVAWRGRGLPIETPAVRR